MFCLFSHQGASIGCLIGTALSTWIAFGSYTIDKQYGDLPVNTANCTTDDAFAFSNFTTSPQNITTSLPAQEESLK